MATEKDLEGPYIRWINYGYDGWQPESHATLASLLTSPCGYEFEITKKIVLEIIDGGKVIVKC